MTERRVYVHAAAALGPWGDTGADERRRLDADPPPLDLNALTRATLGAPLRQASHFVELAAIGARLCLDALGRRPPDAAAVYIGTGLAEVRRAAALFRQVMPPGPGLASPFDFINASNNMAAFYVAKGAGLAARNLTVKQEEFSFERALELADGDLRAGAVPAALVGGVDENVQPRSDHLRRITLRDDQWMGEGSAWLYLDGDPAGARAELVAIVEQVTAPDAPADAWAARLAPALAALRRASEPWQLLPGFRLRATEREALRAALPGIGLREYLDHCGCYYSAAGFGVATLFDAAPPPGLSLHVNHDAGGRCVAVALRAL
jgi:hypothetical protein